jgi:hypothetical protein
MLGDLPHLPHGMRSLLGGGGGTARCLLAASAVERHECAARVQAAAAQAAAAALQAHATDPSPEPLPASGGLAPPPADHRNVPPPAWRIIIPSRTAPLRACGQCEGCRQPECGNCAACLDKPKYGGPHRLRKRCENRVCG